MLSVRFAFLLGAKSGCAVPASLRTAGLQSPTSVKRIRVYHDTFLPLGFLVGFEPTQGSVLLFHSFVFLLCVLLFSEAPSADRTLQG